MVVWGYARDGGDLSFGVVYAASTFSAWAALKSDKSVVTWGRGSDGGDSSAVELTDIVRLYSNSKAIVAVASAGAVKAWGRADYGGGRLPSCA